MTTELKGRHARGKEVPSLFHSTCCTGYLSLIHVCHCLWVTTGAYNPSLQVLLNITHVSHTCSQH